MCARTGQVGRIDTLINIWCPDPSQSRQWGLHNLCGCMSAASGCTTSQANSSGLYSSGLCAMVWEICCGPQSTLAAAAADAGFKAQRITLETGYDMEDDASARAVKRLADKQSPSRVWASCPCSPWSSQQNFNKRNPAQIAALQKKRQSSRNRGVSAADQAFLVGLSDLITFWQC